MAETESIKKEIEDNTYFQMPQVQHTYRILLARYSIMKQEMEKGREMLENCQKQAHHLDRFERNLLAHTWGVFFLSVGKTREAMQHLNHINPLEYNNHEFYYHLANAFHHMEAKVKAYHFGSLALSFFQKTNNFKRILDTELLMVIQMESNEIYQFDNTINKYHSLIKSCRSYKEEAKEMNLWHNLGVQYSAKGHYPEAKEAYKKVMAMSERIEHPYLKLGAIRGYIHCSLLSSVYDKNEIEDYLHTGIALAKRLQNKTYLYGFEILHLQLGDKQVEEYFSFLENTFLPHLRLTGNRSLLSLYEKELFHYFREKGNYQKACELSIRYIEPAY
ncbi:XRE family transcriptional regulator [Bacillus haimaensis]|uniref:XRE family transcriptional regulator n=1 Tax=Bacillus haimaensis TaxID=3160967 RepID=UPI003AA9A909